MGGLLVEMPHQSVIPAVRSRQWLRFPHHLMGIIMKFFENCLQVLSSCRLVSRRLRCMHDRRKSGRRLIDRATGRMTYTCVPASSHNYSGLYIKTQQDEADAAIQTSTTADGSDDGRRDDDDLCHPRRE
eukprot:scaffold149840_cov22-Prasinocladus_malaysianus.AAC.1